MAIKLRTYLRKTLYVISLIMLIGLLLVLRQKQNEQICTEMKIAIEAPLEKELLSNEIIQKEVNSWFQGGLIGVERQTIDLNKLEENLEAMPAVLNAEVSFDLNGVLLLEIEQRIPCLRVINGGDSYYLDLNEVKIPVNGTETARVPVAIDVRSEKMIKKIYTLAVNVYENPFTEALTEQIFVNKNGDLVIIPKVKNQKIIIGTTEDLELKFQKLLDFYREGLVKIGWEHYTTINLKYKEQVVCN